MKTVFLIISGWLYFSSVTDAQDSIQARIVLIGDAGKLSKDGRQPVIKVQGKQYHLIIKPR